MVLEVRVTQVTARSSSPGMIWSLVEFEPFLEIIHAVQIEPGERRTKTEENSLFDMNFGFTSMKHDFAECI